MDYKFSDIERDVKEFWKKHDVYRVELDRSKPKYYALDFFPYPSGAGLHVGHPLGYIACDIYARYKRLKGFNVLHPMGFDSFGLPAEQYAIQTGQHPAITTEKNIQTFKEQLDKIGFSFDWSREIRTSDPSFYKWTQWIFIKLFHSWYNKKTDKAEPIDSLIKIFEQEGNKNAEAASGDLSFKTGASGDEPFFSANDWKNFSAKEKSDVLLSYRIAYIADSWVNWAPALGTVLANDEVKDGVSERGGYPVERKLMKQWSLRITAYAERLLEGLEKIDWSEAIKESQRNWIGKSEGCSVKFEVDGSDSPLPRRGAGGEERTLVEQQDSITNKPPGYLTADPQFASYLQLEAAKSRKQPTEAEKILWDLLRNRKLNDKFRRQHPIADFIVDFVCLEKKLIVELDGEHHKENREYDIERTRILTQLGYEVMRFWNEEVIKNPYEVAKKIRAALQVRPSLLTPDPSPKERGEVSSSDEKKISIEVFTTRPDTIFGVSFITLAPEHELVQKIATPEYKKQVEEYVNYAKNRSERERMTDIKKITGQFTGAYAIHPFSGKQIPIWIGEYVLATYGTGAVMGVPGHDERDHRFATHFGLSIISIIEGVDVSEKTFEEKEGIVCNSDFLNGLPVPDAIKKAIGEIEKKGIGKRKVNYKMRDAIFGRQRYWGEPIPIYYDDEGIPHTIDENDLPLVLPEVDKYLPTESGEPPLARATNWKYKGKYEYELTTMPGWAGSNWYYLRYEDPHNEEELASKEAIDYWQNMDLYLGGDEHATGHLMYFRFCTKFLFDIGVIPFDEPAKKLVNQGKIQGVSAYIVSVSIIDERDNTEYDSALLSLGLPKFFVSKEILDAHRDKQELQFYLQFENEIVKSKLQEWRNSIRKNYPTFDGDFVIITYPTPIDINYVDGDIVDEEKMRNSRPEYKNAIFLTQEGGAFHSERIPEKMSKSKYNVVNPDEVVEKYGADSFRLYEMFLGPLEQHKPWDTKGIDGVFRFLKKFWKLFYDEEGKWMVNENAPTKEELKILHRTIRKAGDDIEEMSFNTSVSAFMICVNELTQLNSHKRKILEPMLIIMSPFAPFITEYLWQKLGNTETVVKASFPKYDESLLVETSFEYPVAVNGKTRVRMNFDLDLPSEQIEKEVISAEALQKYFDGKTPKKVIVVKGRMINVVV